MTFLELFRLFTISEDTSEQRSDIDSGERRESTLAGGEDDVAASTERERERERRLDELRTNLEYREQLLLDQQQLLAESLSQQKQGFTAAFKLLPSSLNRETIGWAGQSYMKLKDEHPSKS